VQPLALSLLPVEAGEEAIAGAFSVGRGAIARATLTGIDLIELEPGRSRATVRERIATPFAAQPWGVQLTPGGVVALGGEVSQARVEPRDWRMRLVWWSRAERAWRGEARLPPGNWRLVRGTADDERAVVYDVSEEQGVVGYDVDTRTALWHAPLPSLWRLGRDGDGALIALTRDRRLFALDERSGVIFRQATLPLAATHAWTAAAPLDDDWLLLGGAHRERRAWVLARFRLSDEAVEPVAELSWSAVADEELVARCESDAEHCGFDLGDVANLVVEGPRALVALGGDGEQLGACQSACALALVSLSDGVLRVALVDRDNGSSGLAPLGDGCYLSDCGGTLCVVRVSA